MEKRSIERHLIEEYVHLDGGEGSIPARTIDISRNGMKIVVNQPYSFDKIHRISVNLPGDRGDGIPCHIRRSKKADEQWEIGLEFDGETDARMLLIERWLESLENHRWETDSAPTESRQVPRTRCTITDISCEQNDVKVFSAEDLSVDGMLLRLSGEISSGDLLIFSMKLSENIRRITFSGRVAYLVDDSLTTSLSAGIAIEKIRETDRNLLRKFIVDIASGVAMLEYHKLLEREEPSNDFRIDSVETVRLIKTLGEKGLIMNLLDEEALSILETRIEEINKDKFLASSPVSKMNTAFFSFTMEDASYSFSTVRTRWSNGIGTFLIPSVIYRGEKRSGKRKNDTRAIELAASSLKVSGRIIDSSRRGVLCEIPTELFQEYTPVAGQSMDISVNGITTPGEIRHIVENRNKKGNTVLRIGLETGIIRKKPYTTIYNEKNWKDTWNGPEYPLNNPHLARPRVISYTDCNERKIVALLHILDPNKPCTAVIIPPAFGKKKEALAPLALTLMANFSAAGENIAVLRYDGIDRPGESDNTNRHARRGYEMLGYRINQGYTDLEATMQWVQSNNLFKAEKTVLISSSMSALDARRLQSAKTVNKADYWISLMGVSSAQGTLRNVLGGLDVIANHRMGLPIGTMGMLGQLVDMDRMAADMTHLGYATIADAREAMSHIETPVTWLFGVFDKWMITEEIRDIMSIKSPGSREVIEIPTAHNLRTSNDAISAFQLISSAIIQKLHKKTISVVSPDKGELLDLLTRERERVTENEHLDLNRYWKGYLVGESEGEEGYDFYSKLAEFHEFVHLQASLLNPRPGESIADMGCGTGLVSEAILLQLAKSNNDLKGSRFTAVDLINEALDKASSKYQKLCLTHRNLDTVEDSWIAMNLEPDAFAGIKNAIFNSEGGLVRIETLIDRVKGLKSETFDRMGTVSEETISEILKGKQIEPDLWAAVEETTTSGDTLILRDLNRAARFVTGNLYEEDLKPSRRLGTGPLNPKRLEQIRSSDMFLAILDFGDWNREGKLPIKDETFDAINASLFLSYLFAPGEAVKEFARMLKPDGRLVISTMKPDSDISGIFTKYIAEQSDLDAQAAKNENREQNLREARSMLNEAAALLSLEEDGWFRFFEEEELIKMMRNAGFTNIKVIESLGNPAQAIIVYGNKK